MDNREKAKIFVNNKLGDKNYTHSKYPMHREEIETWLCEFVDELQTIKEPKENVPIKEIKRMYKEYNFLSNEFIKDNKKVPVVLSNLVKELKSILNKF